MAFQIDRFVRQMFKIIYIIDEFNLIVKILCFKLTFYPTNI